MAQGRKILSPWCGKKDVPTGVILNQYAGSGSFIRWHSDNEPLFGPQNLPKLIVSLSLGNSVEFMVRRRASGNVPSSIRLDHGDVLVMDALAQSEYEHCTVPGLPGPGENKWSSSLWIGPPFVDLGVRSFGRHLDSH